MFFLRKSSLERLPVVMSGVRMGERYLQVFCRDVMLTRGLASKTGLSGAAALAAADATQAARANAAASKVGALIDVQIVKPDAFPWESGSFDMVVLDDTGGDFSSLTPLDRRAIGVRYQDASNIARWAQAGAGVRCRGNTWFIPYETIQSRDKERPHPATFPTRLPEQCLKLHGLDRVKLVVDPFLGLGSTAVACARLGLPCVGVELDEHYLREAIDRTRAALER